MECEVKTLPLFSFLQKEKTTLFLFNILRNYKGISGPIGPYAHAQIERFKNEIRQKGKCKSIITTISEILFWEPIALLGNLIKIKKETIKS